MSSRLSLGSICFLLVLQSDRYLFLDVVATFRYIYYCSSGQNPLTISEMELMEVQTIPQNRFGGKL